MFLHYVACEELANRVTRKNFNTSNANLKCSLITSMQAPCISCPIQVLTSLRLASSMRVSLTTPSFSVFTRGLCAYTLHARKRLSSVWPRNAHLCAHPRKKRIPRKVPAKIFGVNEFYNCAYSTPQEGCTHVSELQPASRVTCTLPWRHDSYGAPSWRQAAQGASIVTYIIGIGVEIRFKSDLIYIINLK